MPSVRRRLLLVPVVALGLAAVVAIATSFVSTGGDQLDEGVAEVGPEYAIDPLSCVQLGETVAYRATVANLGGDELQVEFVVSVRDGAGGVVDSRPASVRVGRAGRELVEVALASPSELGRSGGSCSVDDVAVWRRVAGESPAHRNQSATD